MRPEQKSEKSKSFFGDDEGHLHMRPWTGFILTTWETAEDTRAQKWVGIDRVTEKRRSHQRRGRTTGGWVLCYCDLTEFCWLQGKATGVGAECFNQRERHDPVWRVLSSYSWAHSNGRQRQMHTVGRAHNSLWKQKDKKTKPHRPSESQLLLPSTKERGSGAPGGIKTKEQWFIPWKAENAMPRGSGKINDAKCPLAMKFLCLIGPLRQRAPFKRPSSSSSGCSVWIRETNSRPGTFYLKLR